MADARWRRRFSWGIAAIVAAAVLLPAVVDPRALVRMVGQQRVAMFIRETAGRGEAVATVEGRRFLIPGGYFLYPNDPSTNDMLLWYLWPELEPYSAERHYEFWKAVGDEVRTITLMARGNSIAPKWFQTFVEDGVGEGRRSDAADDLGLFVWEGAAREDDVFTPADTSLRALLRCNKIGSAPSPQCKLMAWYKDDVFLSIGFPRRLIAEWRQILEGSRGLLERFEANAENRGDAR